jgi:hypothetical protein
MINELPVLHVQRNGQMPRAIVVSGGRRRPATLAAVKRARYVQNLKNNYQRLKEALDFVEYFAGVSELSPARLEAIRLAKDDALEELSAKVEEKLKVYDSRLEGDVS